MAPALSRSLYTSPLTSVPITPLSSRLSHLRSSFLPRGDALRTGVSCSWNLEKRCNRFAVKCDAAVAEKETTEEGDGEKFEYQAEMWASVPKAEAHKVFDRKSKRLVEELETRGRGD